MTKPEKIIFVYNVDSSFFAQATAYIQKFIPSSSSVCNLCHLTIGKKGVNKEWKRFVKSLPYKVVIIHRDEFRQKFSNMSNTTLPTIMIEKNNKITEFLNTKEINRAKNIDQLIKLIKNKLNND